MDQAKLQGCFEAQRAAFRRTTPDYVQRREALRSLDHALVQHKKDIISAISDDFGGRAAEETLALELFPTLNEIRHAISNLKRWMKPRCVPVSWQFWPARAEVWYQPLGVVGILSAWNYPLFLSYVPLANALAAGNHVMLKPSEFAPRTAELLGSIAAELYSPDYVSVVLGERVRHAVGHHSRDATGLRVRVGVLRIRRRLGILQGDFVPYLVGDRLLDVGRESHLPRRKWRRRLARRRLGGHLSLVGGDQRLRDEIIREPWGGVCINRIGREERPVAGVPGARAQRIHA